MLATENFIRYHHVDSVAETPRGLLAQLHDEQLQVELVSADIVRFSITRAGTFDQHPTFAVCVDPLSREVDFRVERDDDQVRVITEALTVTLWLEPFRFDVHRADGSPVIETATDEDGHYWSYATLNDAFTLRRRCRREDAIYGLGEKSGRHNRKGRDFTFWNLDVLNPSETAEFTRDKAPDDPRGDRTSVEMDPFYASIPFFYHHDQRTGAVAGSFVDNGYRATYEFSDPTEYRITFTGGQYSEYVFAGPRMPAVLRDYTWLTGRAAPPPIWALGYHQCRWAGYSQDEVEAIGQRHRDDAIPCDTLWLDIEYMDGYRVFTWNTELFPDVPGMLERLSQQGFRVITIVDPGVKYDPGYPVFDQGRERDVFCRTAGGDIYIGQVWPGNTAFPDFVTEQGRAWWGELNAEHVRSGLAGIWNDMNEPATGSIPSLPMRFGHGEYPHEQFHNQYALLMAMGTRDGLLAAMPTLRTFILSRSGFAGIQRYAANWMGDNLARWDHLELSIAMGAGFGISGQPFVGADIGGFMGDTDAELLVRWMQYGTLTPFCRNHSVIDTVDQYAWSFGSRIEDLIRAAIELRYRLLPYLYTSFLRSTETGEPVQRPLVFDHQDDGTVRDIDDQYLFGPDLLVAPVTGPGTTARSVYLPAGEWYDWHSGEGFAGGSFLAAETPLDRIPVYARAGAVIPMWPAAPPSTSGYHPELIELHVFVPTGDETHASRLVEDDGLTLTDGEPRCYRTELTLTRAGDRLTLGGAVRGPGYAEFRRSEFRVVLHGATAAGAELDDRRIDVDPAAVTFPNAGTDFELTISLDPSA